MYARSSAFVLSMCPWLFLVCASRACVCFLENSRPGPPLCMHNRRLLPICASVCVWPGGCVGGTPPPAPAPPPFHQRPPSIITHAPPFMHLFMRLFPCLSPALLLVFNPEPQTPARRVNAGNTPLARRRLPASGSGSPCRDLEPRLSPYIFSLLRSIAPLALFWPIKERGDCGGIWLPSSVLSLTPPPTPPQPRSFSTRPVDGSPSPFMFCVRLRLSPRAAAA